MSINYFKQWLLSCIRLLGYFKIRLGDGSIILNGNLTMNGRALDSDINLYFIGRGVHNPTLI